MFSKMSIFYDKNNGQIYNIDGGEISVEERYLDEPEKVQSRSVLVKDFNMTLFNEIWMFEVIKYKLDGSEEEHFDIVLKPEYEQFVPKADWRIE